MKSALHVRWPNYWSFSFSISASNEYSWMIFFRIDCFDLLALQGTLKSLLQHHSSKASIIQCLAFFMVQLSCSYKTTGETIALTAAKSLQSCLTPCNPRDSSPPGSPIPGILQARILEWVAISFSRGSSQPRDWTWVSCIAGRCFILWVNAGLNEAQAGIKIAGRSINNLRYADGTTLVAEGEEESLDESEREEWKSWLKAQHSDN